MNLTVILFNIFLTNKVFSPGGVDHLINITFNIFFQSESSAGNNSFYSVFIFSSSSSIPPFLYLAARVSAARRSFNQTPATMKI